MQTCPNTMLDPPLVPLILKCWKKNWSHWDCHSQVTTLFLARVWFWVTMHDNACHNYKQDRKIYWCPQDKCHRKTPGYNETTENHALFYYLSIWVQLVSFTGDWVILVVKLRYHSPNLHNELLKIRSWMDSPHYQSTLMTNVIGQTLYTVFVKGNAQLIR